MKTRRVVLSVLLSTLMSVLCWAALTRTVTEDFEGAIEEALWRAGPEDEIVPDGGNPGAFLRNAAAVAAVPTLVTETPGSSVFTGPYGQMGVSHLGVDLEVFAVSGDVRGRPVSLGIQGGVYTGSEWISCELIFPGDEVPQPGSGWRAYTFGVPAWKRHMPSKVTVHGSCADLPRDDVWRQVIGWVSVARFYVGDPGASYEPQAWDIAFDNPRITIGKFTDHMHHDAALESDGPVPMEMAPVPNE